MRRDNALGDEGSGAPGPPASSRLGGGGGVDLAKTKILYLNDPPPIVAEANTNDSVEVEVEVEGWNNAVSCYCFTVL